MENKSEEKPKRITPEEYEKWMKTPITWEAAYCTARSNVEGTLLQIENEIKNLIDGDEEWTPNMIMDKMKMFRQILCHRMDELGEKANLTTKEQSKIIVPKPGLRILR